MKVGACGIACDPGCGLFAKGLCQGCDPARVKQIPCPVLSCAVKRKVQYCGRDCSDFPCKIVAKFPYGEAYTGMYKSRAGKTT
jgi:hypothetical protein